MGTMANRPINVLFNERAEIIADAVEAIDFLQRWPEARRGHIYQSAFTACTAAAANQIPEIDAMRTFMGFAKVSNIYVQSRDVPIPHSDGPQRHPLFKRGWS